MDAYGYYLAGNECLKKSEYASAVDFFTKSNTLAPHFKTFEKLFFCYYSLDQTDKAFDCISRAYDLNNKNDKIALEYTKILIEYKCDYTRAEIILLDILKRNPLYKPAEKLLGALSKKLGDSDGFTTEN